MPSETPSLAIMVAVARNGVIGCDNQLPWHLPEDLKWFKQKTMGKPMIMGRKTFESLRGVLPGRPHIVVSRDSGFQHEGVAVAKSVDEAIELARASAVEVGADEIMVIGGASLYQQMLGRVSRVYRTLVDLEPKGDSHFQELGNEWIVTTETENFSNGVKFIVQVVEKVL